MSGIIDFLSHSLPSLLVMVSILIAIELFPSLSLSGGHNWGSLSKNTSISICINQITEEHVTISISHVLCFIENVKSIKLIV